MSRLRVLVDYRPALRARTGAGAYMHGLVRAYTARHDDDVAVFSSSWKDRVAGDTGAALRARVVDRRVPVRWLNYLWHRRSWPPVEWLAGSADVVHAAHPLLIPARDAAQVVTIHDLYFLSNPEATRAEIRRDYSELARAHARRADAVVTSSAYTRDALLAVFELDPARVHLVRPGAPTWRQLGHAPHAPRDGYVLFIGTLDARKNLGVVLDAYEHLAAHGRRVPRLMVAGGAGPGGEAWLERLKSGPLSTLADYRGYVPEPEREALFLGARAVVLPSWDEGFGLPALEAMTAGIPVVVSNRGALPEVVGEAGILVDPTEPQAWAEAIGRLAQDDVWADERGAAGLERARAFRWDDAADALHAAYTDAVQCRGRRA
jgi:glycosyltransferase involved in cell wall biosynthesis